MNLNQKLKNRNSPHQVKLPDGEPPEQLDKNYNFDALETPDIEESPEREELDLLYIQVDKKMSNKVVIIEVEDRDNEYIVVRCHNAAFKHEQHLLTEPIKAPRVSFDQYMTYLAELKDKNTQLQDKDQKLKVKIRKTCRKLKGEMYDFSSKNTLAIKIRRWLIKVIKKLDTDFQQTLSYIIINDRTDFEIPWEMLELEEQNKYLGAAITTVRWQDIIDPYNLQDTSNSDRIYLEVASNDCCGDLVAYINTKDLDGGEQDRETLQQFKHYYYDDLEDFLKRLRKPNSAISLVFISSHGSFGDDITFGANNMEQQISLKELSGCTLTCLQESRSIVFMNACHSGRLEKDPNLHPDLRRGFATFFLEKGARGFIGTLNKVGDQCAAKITQNFFREYERNPQLSVAKILQNLRVQAVEQLQADENYENMKLFFFTFMYIYYGNPMTKLKLDKL